MEQHNGGCGGCLIPLIVIGLILGAISFVQGGWA